MAPNPPLGVVLHAIGGLMSAIFYLPYRKVKHWSWESYWIVGGVFSWIVAPWIIASLAVPNLLTTLSHAPAKSLFWSYFFGVLWGVGGLTFGLTVRYLGFALGTAMALGYCAAFGTLLPPIFNGEFGGVLQTTSGLVVMGGVIVCLLGIVISGFAGIAKEKELPDKEKTASVKEFSFKKGVWVATFCGIMSACMSYGFAAGKPIAEVAEVRVRRRRPFARRRDALYRHDAGGVGGAWQRVQQHGSPPAEHRSCSVRSSALESAAGSC